MWSLHYKSLLFSLKTIGRDRVNIQTDEGKAGQATLFICINAFGRILAGQKI